MITMICLMWWSSSQAGIIDEKTISFGAFGDVHLYHTEEAPSLLVVFISGDGGWNLGVVDMARELASTSALVAGVDIIHYVKAIREMNGKCVYPAAHFESLSQFLQQQYNFAEYSPPVLVGYSSGATLVYAVLAQSPPNTFQGGISLGFCPDLPLPKPLCKGSGDLTWVMDQKKAGTYIFNPVSQLPSPWVVLQGTIDQVCLPDVTKAYVEKVGNGKIIMLPKVGHGYSVPKNWMPQFRQVFHDMTTTSSEVQPAEKSNLKGGLSDLPLVELPVSGKGDRLAVIVTGDGGWAGIDKSLGEALNREGIPVVGLNSLKYFWHRKTPEQSAVDLGRIIHYYVTKWHRDHIILIGYSRGADVVPFMVNRLEEDARSLIKEIVVMGPQSTVDFQFHVTDWLTSGRHDTELPVMPEMQKLENQNVMCIYGSDEKGVSLCPRLDNNRFRVVEMRGGHHFGGDYDKLARIIMEHVK